MSQENIEVLKAIWPLEADLVAMFENPELPAQLAAAIDPDVEVAFSSSAPGTPDLTYRGIAGLAQGWLDWLEPYESYRLTVEDVIDAGGDRVLAPSRVVARTRRDGVLIEHSPAAIFTIRDGKLVKASFHLDRLQAFEAAGLRE